MLKPGGTVYLLGGPEALSDEVERAFSNAGLRTQRLFGADRYATAVAVARRGQRRHPRRCCWCRERTSPMRWSPARSPPSCASPILLTSPEGVPGATADHLRSLPQAKRTVVGGPVAVSDDAYNASGASERIFGADRYETSVRVAQRWWASVQHLSVATGATFQDTLAGAAWSARAGIPLVLVSSDPGPVVRSYVSSVEAGLVGTIVYGTVSAVSDAVLGSLFK